MNDLTLVKRVLNNEPGSFDELVKQYQKLVWHIVSKLVQNSEDTLELSQEVFLQVYNKLGQYKGGSQLSTWIGRIAYHFAVRFLQKQDRQLDEVDIETEAVENETGNSQHKELQNRQLKQQMHTAMKQLPVIQQTIISLYHLEELTLSEISEITELPQGTIKSHLFRARSRLKQILKAKREYL
ncbi:RNA polymerase sigma factor [Kangiella koreensis]|uniref:RNA polymerase, sigma-24 subunit, ECF subfamily n=1 Tax=Kangiella koreensis (strain DSM 16069 / JCM 12317 / KCTC 12182 / SW-125) TaxID=523791 RepID=C7RD23_KANKD|nr:sigma-70 family RNA polymerase sigma factor [Kangiella koreensis]ACV27165.1 RNA polymerase, sigma-24 subunit, ECF subfamily [Kangiella koreensis DSM 16069]